MASKIVQDFYTYAVETANLAPAASSSSVITIEADSNFVLVKMSYFADIAGAAQTESSRVVPLVNITIQDTGSGRNLQSKPIAIDSIAGRGNLPFVLPVPRRFRGSSAITITFTNSSAGTTYTNIRLALIGYKEIQIG